MTATKEQQEVSTLADQLFVAPPYLSQTVPNFNGFWKGVTLGEGLYIEKLSFLFWDEIVGLEHF